VYELGYGLMADRCSNGPHTTWADPLGPGGQPDREDWNMDNFGGTPRHRAAMVETAENVAREIGITKEECDETVLRRYAQFMEGRANDRAFQKRYMFSPEVTVNKKKTKFMEEDEGWTPTTADVVTGVKLTGTVGGGGNSRTAILSWTPPTFTATDIHYHINRDTSYSGSGNLPTEILDQYYSTTWTSPSFSKSTQYYWQVNARYDKGGGVYVSVYSNVIGPSPTSVGSTYPTPP